MLCSRARTALMAALGFLCCRAASSASCRMVASLVSLYLRDCLMALVTAVIKASSFLSIGLIIPIARMSCTFLLTIVENAGQKTYTDRAPKLVCEIRPFYQQLNADPLKGTSAQLKQLNGGHKMIAFCCFWFVQTVCNKVQWGRIKKNDR